MSFQITEDLITAATVGLTAMTTAAGLAVAIRSGELKRIRFGSFEIEATTKEKAQARLLLESVSQPDKKELPFEIEQLAGYYAQVLAQSKVSFWFSLIFASIGFLIIVIAGFKFFSTEISAAAIQLASGTIIDAVAALFFVQSNKAQSSMAAFFEKLRLDRQQSDAKALCESITDEPTKNAMKVQLALYLSGIPHFDQISKNIVDACLSRNVKNG